MVSDIISGVAANLIQFALIVVLGIITVERGGKVAALSQDMQFAINSIRTLFRTATRIPDEARGKCKQLIKDLANSIARIKVKNFNTTSQKETEMERLEKFWAEYGEAFQRFEPRAGVLFESFQERTSSFLDRVIHDFTNAAPSLQNEFRDSVKASWRDLFDAIYAETPLALDDEEVRRLNNLNILALGDRQPIQNFIFHLFGFHNRTKSKL